jgi:DNA polymerase-1
MARDLKQKGLWELFIEIELPLIGVLVEMERAGVKVDREKLDTLSSEYEKRLATLEDELYRQAGEVFNPRSPKDLSRILFEKLRLPTIRKTATGFSTDAAVLEELALSHPLPATLLEHRNLSKLKSSFIDALPKLVSPKDGRIHTTFNQTVAATGRLSSSNPNLQNIPVRGAEGRRIREAFVAEPGYVLLSSDYSQIELRILAHMSKDRALAEIFASGRDIHAETASRLFDVGPFGVTTEMRRQAKTVNFGILYGISPFGLARQLGVDRDTASKMIRTYFERFPGVRAFLDSLIDSARQTGESRTLFGRLRLVPELGSRNRGEREAGERLAVNSPLQGTAADLIKRAMLAARDGFRQEKIDGRLTLQVHDELVFEVRAAEVERAKELVRTAMEGAAQFDVPLKVDIGYGSDWYAAHG